MSAAEAGRRAIAAVCGALMLHGAVLDTVRAETAAAMIAAARQADDPVFRVDPADLYSAAEGGRIDLGARDPALSAFDPRDLFQGAAPLTQSLPPVERMEELLPHRDAQLAAMAQATGGFTPAEAAALALLSGRAGLPGLGAAGFLAPGRALLSEEALIEETFGACRVVTQTAPLRLTHVETTREVCETRAYDPRPLMAFRRYLGPAFSHAEIDGAGFCSDGQRQIRVDGRRTCDWLSVFATLPEASLITGCADGPVCLELHFGGRIETVLEEGLPEAGSRIVETYQCRLSENQNVCIFPFWSREWVWQGQRVAASQPPESGPRYLKGRLLERSTGGYTGTYEIFETNTYAILRETRLPVAGQAQTRFTLRPEVTVTGARLIVTAIEPGSAVTGTDAGAPLATAPGVYPLAGAGGWNGAPQVVGFPLPEGADTHQQARLQITLEAPLFTPWVYSAAQKAAIDALAGAGCRVTETILASARQADGCVQGLAEGDAPPARICGPDLPAAPFEGLSDRAATEIRLDVSCDPGGPAAWGPAAPDLPEGVFATDTNCGALAANPACLFMERRCIDTIADGTCLTFEDSYTCQERFAHESPQFETVNICRGEISCLGGDCTLDGSSSGVQSLAGAAAQLSAVEMMLGDMSCGGTLSEPGLTRTGLTEAVAGCTLFAGEARSCKRVTLGLANCCTTPSGISLADYLALAFAVNRLNASMVSLGMENAFTGTWTTLGDLASDGWDRLSRPLVESWESVVGNNEVASSVSGAASLASLKNEMFRQAAQWTADVFGPQAANALFAATQDGVVGAAVIDGKLRPGTIGWSATAQSAMYYVSIAFTVYAIVNILAAILFACSEEELELGVARALRKTQFVGRYCSSKTPMGWCLARKDSYCMFSSPLSRIMNAQIRAQQGLGWGTARQPDCRGFSLAEVQALDWDRIDLSEWTGMLARAGMLDTARVADVEALTGAGSSLGVALSDLHAREDAITRNLERLEGQDLDAARRDAAGDFGLGLVDY